MTREQMIAHLALHGWVPKLSRIAAIENDTMRLFIRRTSKLDPTPYVANTGAHPPSLDAAWEDMADRWLKMLYEDTFIPF